jgi:hypothetical protein
MTVVMTRFGRLFGVGSISLVAFACSEAAFTGEEEPNGADVEIGSGGRAGQSSSAGKGGAAADGPAEKPDAVPVNGPGTSSVIVRGGATNKVDGESAGAAGMEHEVLVDGEGGQTGQGTSSSCSAPIHDTWQSNLGERGNPWVLEFGDPYVDTGSGRLVVSYDDVASRSKAFSGGYYVSADVTLEGYTVLTPYPFVWEVSLPSLRRNAAGTGIELGSTSYGLGEPWQQAPAGFAGVTIPSTETVRVSTYVKATSKQLAVKVQAGSQSYRSGWVSGFTWKKTDLGIFRFVGENNSSVYAGDSDYVYVGAVDGCEQLSDEAVEQLYASGS